MTKNVPKLVKLENDPLWREACDIAEHVYGKLHELPDEEKWDTVSKLRGSANSLMFFVSQGIGNASPSGSEFDWGMARKSLASLKTMYRFAGRQKFIELDPEVMVRFDKMMDFIDAHVAESYKQTEDYNRKDVEMWQKKYTMWKAANREG